MQQGFPKKEEGIVTDVAVVAHPEKTRSLEDILQESFMECGKLSMCELDMLWRYVMGKTDSTRAYVEFLIDILDGAVEHQQARQLFHQLWGMAKGRPGYVKNEWKLLRMQIFLHGVEL